MRDFINTFGLGNFIVAVITAVIALLIIGAGFDFDLGEVLEVLAVFAIITVSLGALAVLPHVVGLILESLDAKAE